MANNWQEDALTAQRRAEMEQAQQSLKQYGSYQSGYQQDLDKAYRDISDRKAFSYDLGSDALYRQYKDQYVRGGKLAMQDTVGQASAMTGGYGNSYAATAGNQAFQDYLTRLNDQIPALQQAALNAYTAEGDRLQQRYALAKDADDAAYGRWQDGYDRLADAAAQAASRYDSDRNFSYGSWNDLQERTAESERLAAQLAQQKELAELDRNAANERAAAELALQRELAAMDAALTREKMAADMERARLSAAGGSGSGAAGEQETNAAYEADLESARIGEMDRSWALAHYDELTEAYGAEKARTIVNTAYEPTKRNKETQQLVEQALAEDARWRAMNGY